MLGDGTFYLFRVGHHPVCLLVFVMNNLAFTLQNKK